MQDKPTFYTVIPADVRYDENLSANCKLLFSEILFSCRKNGTYWASNRCIANLLNVKIRAVNYWIASLVEEGYITIEHEYVDGTKNIDKRIIYITGKGCSGITLESAEVRANICIPPSENKEQTQCKKILTSSAKNCTENNNIINNNNNNYTGEELFFKNSSQEIVEVEEIEVQTNKNTHTLEEEKKRTPKVPQNPPFAEWESFCKENGFGHIAEKSFGHYERGGWKDSNERPIRNWKLKLRQVWFDPKKNPPPSQPKQENQIKIKKPTISNEYKY